MAYWSATNPYTPQDYLKSAREQLAEFYGDFKTNKGGSSYSPIPEVDATTAIGKNLAPSDTQQAYVARENDYSMSDADGLVSTPGKWVTFPTQRQGADEVDPMPDPRTSNPTPDAANIDVSLKTRTIGVANARGDAWGFSDASGIEDGAGYSEGMMRQGGVAGAKVDFGTSYVPPSKREPKWDVPANPEFQAVVDENNAKAKDVILGLVPGKEAPSLYRNGVGPTPETPTNNLEAPAKKETPVGAIKTEVTPSDFDVSAAPKDANGTPIVGNAPAPVNYQKDTSEQIVQQVFANSQPDENGIRTIPASMNMLKDSHEIGDYNYSESRVLFQSALAGGIALLASRLLGANREEGMGVMAMALGDTYINMVDQRARAKGIDSLVEEGYTKWSVEEFIKTGDKEVLKKREISPWQERNDGTFIRFLPDGSAQIWGNPKANTQSVKFTSGGYEYMARWDNNKGDYVRDANGNIIFDGKGSMTSASVSLETARMRAEGSNGLSSKEIAANNNMVGQYQSSMARFDQMSAPFLNSDGSVKPMPTFDNSTWSGVAANQGMEASMFLGGGPNKIPPKMNWFTSQNPALDDYVKGAQQLNSTLRNDAIALAKAAGASGINTAAEIAIFEATMPPLDWTTKETFERSLARMSAAYKLGMDQLLRKIEMAGGNVSNLQRLSATEQPSPQSATSTKPYAVKR